MTDLKDLSYSIVEKCTERGLRLGTAESCTGGLLSSAITEVPGSSKVFWGSVVSYSNEIRQNLMNQSYVKIR